MKKDIFEIISEVKNKFPEDVERIDEEVKSLKDILVMQNYAEQEGSKLLAKMCREQIGIAQRRLATDKSLIGDEKSQRDLWLVIDSRMWILGFLSKDYKQEVENMRNQFLNDLL